MRLFWEKEGINWLDIKINQVDLMLKNALVKIVSIIKKTESFLENKALIFEIRISSNFLSIYWISLGIR